MGNVRLARLFGKIGKCPDKPADKATPGGTNESQTSRRSDRTSAGASEGTDACQQTSRRTKDDTGA
ncbi:hypothetical protein [Mesorhizobium sp.]|uniref:hypothetical protein n=1 Tax=Mesorhizobium sp. TaxID=1871066 RepID=UPI0025EE8F7A|nr:hypothetical protein [Mesorhizobium sp.]